MGNRKGCLVRADACLPTESVLGNVTSFPSKEKVGLIIFPYVASQVHCLPTAISPPLRIFLRDS